MSTLDDKWIVSQNVPGRGTLRRSSSIPFPRRWFESVILMLAALGGGLGDPSASQAEIYRWDNGQLIAGTEGITPGPSAQLDHRDLTFANLRQLDLTGGTFEQSNLARAWLAAATLTEVNLTGAVVTGTDLGETTALGFTQAQLDATASFQAKELVGIGLASNDLTGWDFPGQNLTNASLWSSTLTDADFTTANLTSAYLGDTTTTRANFTGANLRNANFYSATEIASATFSPDTIYNQWTVFPTGFEPNTAGLTLMTSPFGDFDANDVLDVADVDMLSDWINNSSELFWLPYAMFDLLSDGVVNEKDLRVWVQDLRGTWFGDANLDGEFNSTDLIAVLTAGEYEDSIKRNSGWATGDWNADGDFNTSDLLVAWTDGGYEQGPRPATRAVPEPSSVIVLMTMLGVPLWRRLLN